MTNTMDSDIYFQIVLKKLHSKFKDNKTNEDLETFSNSMQTQILNQCSKRNILSQSGYVVFTNIIFTENQ